MSGYHLVTQGEHIAGIAADYGFTDYLVIWNHPNNSQLKSTRQNPNVLYPGDRVFIPEKNEKHYNRSVDKRHRFQVKAKPLKLKLVLKDAYEKPIANTPCVLTVDTNTRKLTTDAEGRLELDIPPTAKQSSLLIQNDQETPYAGTRIPIKIGHLDPIDTVTGQQGRLHALGYYAGEIDGEESDDFHSAVQEFQCEHKLTVDGICGPNTQAKLKQVYGC